MTKMISIKLQIRRTDAWQEYGVQVHPDDYVLDALEAAYKTDTNLLFRHSCHHASCGSCGVRVNGRERLACVTRITDVLGPGHVIRIEPLRNFPVLADLVVDFGSFMRQLDRINLPPIRCTDEKPRAALSEMLLGRIQPHPKDDLQTIKISNVSPNRLENCIECGLCISACPVAGTELRYLGPAGLAAAGRISSEPRGQIVEKVINLVNETDGVWRCHGAFECTEVCPAEVNPAKEIMMLRNTILRGKYTKKINTKRQV